MKSLLAAALAAFVSIAFGATTVPPSLINASGSASGQAILSTGPTGAPVWGAVPLTGVIGTLAVTNGGTGATSASAARTSLGLGTVATQNTGTSGATVPLLNGVNTWASAQAFSVRPTFNSATPWDSANLATPQSAAGVTDGSSAAAGRIGEVITASVDSGSAVSLTAGTAANITSISLTAGDWDVRGQCATAPAGSTIQTVTACAVNTTSATLPGGGNLTGYIYLPFTASAGQPVIAPTSVSRVNVSSTTTVFLVINSSFSTSTNTAYGVIVARRIR